MAYQAPLNSSILSVDKSNTSSNITVKAVFGDSPYIWVIAYGDNNQHKHTISPDSTEITIGNVIPANRHAFTIRAYDPTGNPVSNFKVGLHFIENGNLLTVAPFNLNGVSGTVELITSLVVFV